MADKVSVRALQIWQGKTPVYSFFLNGKDILRIADISRINRDKADGLIGYQRNEVLEHVNEITEYLDSQEVLFPNAVILAMSSSVVFKRSRGPSVGDGKSAAGVLEIPLSNGSQRPAWIVDGQQRTMALMKSKKESLMVPITGFISDDFDVHREQFLLVNKVKPLPKGLINELLPEVNTTLPTSLAKNRIPSALCSILDKDPESPFKGMIIRQTTDRAKNKQAVIADNSLIQVIRSSLNNVYGCLYQYRNVATGEIDVESIRKVLNLYWSEVRDTFPEAWGKHPSKSRLMGGVGMRSMGFLMDRIMGSIHPEDNQAKKKIHAALAALKPYCAWTAGQWPLLNGRAWNQLQNTASDIKLLSNMLIRLYTGVGRE